MNLADKKIRFFAAFPLLLLAGLGGAFQLSAGPYSTGLENQNEDAPDPGIPAYVGPDGAGVVSDNNGLNPLFTDWASYVYDYSPFEEGLDDTWKDTSRTLGPATGEQFDVASLGDMSQEAINAWVADPGNNPGPGSITLGFDQAIRNGEGADFAVFENGFISAGGAGVDGELIAELGYVQVSTDGENFAEFPGTSLTEAAVGPFGTANPTDIYNFAGKHGNNSGDSWGTPFNLDDLLDNPLVVAGFVDVNEINYIRILDIPGNGHFLDSEGNPIYDAWQTSGSGGFDLEAVGTINQVPEPLAFAFILSLIASGVALARRWIC